MADNFWQRTASQHVCRNAYEVQCCSTGMINLRKRYYCEHCVVECMSGWLIGCQMDFRKKSPWSSSLYGQSQLWKGWKHASLHPTMQAEQLFHLSGYHLWKSKTLTCMLPHLRSVFCSLVQIVSPWIFLGLKWFQFEKGKNEKCPNIAVNCKIIIGKKYQWRPKYINMKQTKISQCTVIFL